VPDSPPSAADLRARFDAGGPLTVGLEEELMLLDPVTLDLTPEAPAALSRLADDERFKLELPATQIEAVTPPCATVADAAIALAAARERLGEALAGSYRLAGSGVHPFAAAHGVLNSTPRYDETAREYGLVARRQLVFGLHVHVAVPGADRALAVFNALRSHLPEIAALAANAPYYEGRDSGLASVRPKLCELLPRQGVPPAMATWESLAQAFAWGERSRRFRAAQWWWEARLHPVHGTIEVRVPDTQITVADTAAVGAVIHALVHHLAARHDAGELLPVAETWRIEENRWSACRHGLDGRLADLVTGETRSTRECLEVLLGELEASAARVGATAEFVHARALLGANGARRQREAASSGGLRELVTWLADAFAPISVSPEKSVG
jgi:carboxylate-amine ligase